MLSQIVGRYHFKKRKEDKKMTDLLQTIDNTEINNLKTGVNSNDR